MAVAFAEHPAAASATEVEDLHLGIVGAGKFGTTVAALPSRPATTSPSRDPTRVGHRPGGRRNQTPSNGVTQMHACHSPEVVVAFAAMSPGGDSANSCPLGVAFFW